MKLSECKFGILVQPAEINRKHYNQLSKIGMVVGITENCTKEAIPEVQWQDGTKYGCHHNNLARYEG